MVTTGIYEEYDKYTLVKELPLGISNKKYEEELKKMTLEKEEYIDSDEEKEQTDENPKKKRVMIKKLDSIDVIDVKDDKQWFKLHGIKDVNDTVLMLKKSYGLTNMYLLDTNGIPVKFNTLDDILEDFYQRRRPYYTVRKESMLNDFANKINKMDERVAFIMAVVEKRLKIRNVSKESIHKRMDELGLNKDIYKETKLSSINKDNVDKILKQKEDLIQQEAKLRDTSPDGLWLQDLELFSDEYSKHYNDYRDDGGGDDNDNSDNESDDVITDSD